MRAKSIFQEMWVSGVDWDEALPPELRQKALAWLAELGELSDIKVPRCLKTSASVREESLHVFTDASKDAFGAAAYARYVYIDDSVSSTLIAAKSKVTPLRSVSLPRAELIAAVTGVRLGSEISKTLDIKSVVSWTDSMNVLHCIYGQNKNFKPFIAHRIGEIHQKSNPGDWRHVPTKLNPADLLTRGLRE